MTEIEYTIQELVGLSGVPRRTIYFYTQQEILPPPNGAGLAARYTRLHLMRLRSIPVLRAKGLRLDQIRQRLAEIDEPSLEALISQPIPRPAPTRLPAIDPSSPVTLITTQAQAFTHYSLPGGIVLIVPAHAQLINRQKVEELITAAEKIWANGNTTQRE
jgi:DNA-binding transcriptional MerR regulator